jgi:hypothetical protein
MARASSKRSSSAGPRRQTRATRTSAAGTKRILNCIPSANQEKDWTFEDAAMAGLTAAAAIPASRDLREPAWWNVGNQGSTGSCVGWATADSVLRWHFVKAGRIARPGLLSTRFTWMASKEIDEFNSRPTTFIEPEGTSLKAALDVSRKFGAVRELVLKFGSGALYQNNAQTFYALASQFKIASYINLGRNLFNWRTWLANNGPILTRLTVDSAWYAATANQGRLTTYDAASANGGHAVALVGYDQNMFIVRNSWGTTWGASGFGFASNAYAAAAFTEAYGVTVT